MAPTIDDWIQQTSGALDLADEADQSAVTALADRILGAISTSAALDTLEAELVAREAVPLMLHLAVKLARSKCLVMAVKTPTHVDIAFAMYKEHTRIQPRSDHPQGEDFLVRKVAQLHWLFDDNPLCTWQLLPVDDGCPEGSGRLAQAVAEERLPGEPVTVLFLQDAIDRGLPIAVGLQSPRDSQKGGSVLYGMWYAAQTERSGTHIVAFTDADLSTHLGQVGLLVEPVARGAIAAIGSRREAASIVVKQGVRNTRGKLFIYLWKRLMQPLGYVVDTQCGFKGFRADFIRSVAPTTQEKRFAIDIELLVQAELAETHSITKVPVCWIDSEAASTTTDLQPYLPMLKSIAGMYRRYLPATDEADRFASFLERLEPEQWRRLVEQVPDAIASREPLSFGTWAGVSVQTLVHGAGADAFAPLRTKMEDLGLNELAIANFQAHYTELLAGSTGLISEASLSPVQQLPDAETLDAALASVGEKALDKVVVIKLNGGLGTSMGLSRAKSLLPVRGELTFLDLIARQATQAGCPLVLMNSFSTRDDSLHALKAYPALIDSGLPLDFLQHRVPKLDQQTLLPVTHSNAQLEWCPPGHGDLYTALVTSGALDALLAAGRRYAFVANADNLGAVLDTKILGHFVQHGLPFLMEVADRTLADRKGGHLAMLEGTLILREAAQCPPEDTEAFQDITRHRFFNTNSIWLDLQALRDHIDAQGPLVLPLIRNAKTVDPADTTSTPVYQLESAMGAAIALFDGASAIRVPRTRFAPVKTTGDLLRVRSDAFQLTDDFRLVPNPDAVANPVVIELDSQFYRLVPGLDARFPAGPPSLVQCTRLAITGDVSFGAGVTCLGDVEIRESCAVAEGSVLGR